jgi:hypothetical protein
MHLRKLLRSRRGQSRILEAVIAAAIIFIVFSVSMYFINISNLRALQERADLDRVGYNTLHRLVESGTIEALHMDRIDADHAALFKTIIQKSLPPATYFNLTIFHCSGSDEDSWVKLEPYSNYPIGNIPEDAFDKTMEISSTSIIYTSKTGKIYLLVLVLARAGGNE